MSRRGRGRDRGFPAFGVQVGTRRPGGRPAGCRGRVIDAALAVGGGAGIPGLTAGEARRRGVFPAEYAG